MFEISNGNASALIINKRARADVLTVNDGEQGVVTVVHDRLPDYTGATVVTPSTETQVLLTSGKTVLSDITIEAMPSYYGRITYNGSIITVS